MAGKLLISHHHSDRPIAAAIALAVRRITLSQVVGWFSSDDSPEGRLRAGELWTTGP